MDELSTLRYFKEEGLREELERAERRERARSLSRFGETNLEPSASWLRLLFASRGCA
jgi:hypothetical protein